MTRGIIGLASAATLALACATGGGAEGETVRAERDFQSWESLFRHHAPSARVSGSCITELGRGGGRSITGGPVAPIIEIGQRTSYDGCIPSDFEPQDVYRVEVLSASEATTRYGSRGGGGLVRIYLEE